ncbi:MAG: 4-hydroxy-3-methylbut-2-enyl diphosphate reductase [Deltaproteobacteria bacterium]|nr:4-hydroxy-3-methylbut-2-enyl diphosphate reductase [Deltaproteobacteria bacterium]MBW1937533.1 4-hydroxy-3-methylbut-2-enyl diphosphate reductase [Deltaproteobacteria bacterium]
MKVQLAKVAGFCMGVRRAMDIALEASQNAQPPVYTFGPLIHNPSALSLLKARGVEVLREIPEEGEGTVIIRAHGVLPEEKERLKAAGFSVIDATCPRVVNVQMVVRRHARKGYQCVLIGDKGHPEVIGIMGYAEGHGILVSAEEDIEFLPELDRYIIVAQTTQDQERYEVWSGKILSRYPGGKVFHTICDSTQRRQTEVRRLASETGMVVVVGGKQSANTRRLAEIVAECGKLAMAVETEEELDRERLFRFKHVGVTAGASTPNWIINRVVREVEASHGAFDSIWHQVAYRFVRFLYESNLWTAFAGGALAWSALIIGRVNVPPFIAVAMTFCYIFAMHTLNLFMDQEAGEYNDPLRAKFLSRYKAIFYTSSMLAVSVSLGIARYLSMASFLWLMAISVLGILYTVPVIPGSRRIRALKNLPGSKTFFIALAWASVAVLLPLAGFISYLRPIHWILFILGAVLVYMRSGLLEVLDVQGDRIVGRETLAILIGEKKAINLVGLLSVILGIVSVTLPALGIVPWQFVSFLPASFWMLGLSCLFSGRRIGQNLRLEFMVEASFFLLLAGAIIMDMLPL